MENILDKFDLTKSVKMGLNFLNNNVDMKRDCLPFFAAMFKNDPAEAYHDFPDYGDLTGRYIEAFILVRKMLHKKDISLVEQGLRKLLLSYFMADDGLSYRPKHYALMFKKQYDEPVAEGFDQSRVLWALLRWYQESGDPEILERLEKLIDGLDKKTVKKDDYCYYTTCMWKIEEEIDRNAKPLHYQLYYAGAQIHPLFECYKHFKIMKAFELARQLANFVTYESCYFDDNGEFYYPAEPIERRHWNGHTHSRLAAVAGCIMVGLEIGDKEMVQKMKYGYDLFYKTCCSKSGWSPEFLCRHDYAEEGCETCAVMDHINCCIALTKAGYSQYYHQIEQIARNQLIENQITDTKLFVCHREIPDTELSCFHNVAGMIKGGFAGWAGVNDMIGNCDHHFCLMNCCGPSGLTAMHNVWDNIYTVYKDKTFVNILMNKSDDYIKIKHCQPLEGKLQIVLERETELYLIDKPWFRNAKLSINGKPAAINKEGACLQVGRILPGYSVLLEYDLDVVVEKEFVNGREFTFTWKGDTVVKVNPIGRYMPYYNNRE